MAHCEDVDCTRATLTALGDDPGTPRSGGSASIAIGADGLGLISYLDGGPGGFGEGSLRVAHCQDAVCTRATVSVLDAASHR